MYGIKVWRWFGSEFWKGCALGFVGNLGILKLSDGKGLFFRDLFLRNELGKLDILNVIGETLGIGRFPGLNEDGGGALDWKGSEWLGMHLSGIGRAGFEVEHEKKKVNKVIDWMGKN